MALLGYSLLNSEETGSSCVSGLDEFSDSDDDLLCSGPWSGHQEIETVSGSTTTTNAVPGSLDTVMQLTEQVHQHSQLHHDNNLGIGMKWGIVILFRHL